MASGKYRHRIEAQRTVQTADGAGGTVTAWVSVAEFWAAIEPIGGREAMRANQVLADMDTRVTTRWTAAAAALTAKDRLLVGTTPYSIVRPPADRGMRHREIEIMCNVGLNDG